MEDDERRRITDRLRQARQDEDAARRRAARREPAERAWAERRGAELGQQWAAETASYAALARLAERVACPVIAFHPDRCRFAGLTPGALLARAIDPTLADAHAAARFWAWLLGAPAPACRPLLERSEFAAAFAAAALEVWDEVKDALVEGPPE